VIQINLVCKVLALTPSTWVVSWCRGGILDSFNLLARRIFQNFYTDTFPSFLSDTFLSFQTSAAGTMCIMNKRSAASVPYRWWRPEQTFNLELSLHYCKWTRKRQFFQLKAYRLCWNYLCLLRPFLRSVLESTTVQLSVTCILHIHHYEHDEW